MRLTEEEYRALGFRERDTEQEGPIRAIGFPHETIGIYNGKPAPVRFGTFLGWHQNASDVEAERDFDAIAKQPLSVRCRLFDISHQAGGHACLGRYFYAIPVALKQEMVQFLG
jgi:hypothetical protein